MTPHRRLHLPLLLMALLAAMISAHSFEPRAWKCENAFFGQATYRGTVSNRYVLLEVPGRPEYVRAPISSLSPEDHRWVQAHDPARVPAKSWREMPEWVARGLILGLGISILLHLLILAPLRPPMEPAAMFQGCFQPKKRRRGTPALLTAILSHTCVVIAASLAATYSSSHQDHAELGLLMILFACQQVAVWLATRLNFRRAFLLNIALIAVTAACVWVGGHVRNPTEIPRDTRSKASHTSAPPRARVWEARPLISEVGRVSYPPVRRDGFPAPRTAGSNPAVRTASNAAPPCEPTRLHRVRPGFGSGPTG